MDSPVSKHQATEPRSGERRRRGRGVDVMSAFPTHPTPERRREHIQLPTPVTERRPSKRHDKHAEGVHAVQHPPTPQTLPRKRASPDADVTSPPPSPSGHTTFFLSSGPAAGIDKAQPRRRPGLMFAQQMGITGPSTGELKFGGRLGPGVGMGGALRGSAHGHVDKVTVDDENPFLVTRPSSSHGIKIRRQAPTPGRDTSYVPQALRPSAERSMSPHPTAAMRAARRAGSVSPPASLIGDAGPSTRARRQAMMDEDSPFIARPGEVVQPRPTSEDHPLVTYVFRGSKKVFANPFVPPSTEYTPSTLNPAHPEFDVHPCPAPRLLWPSNATPTQAPETPKGRRHALTKYESMDIDIDAGAMSDDGMDEDSDDSLPARRGLLFGQKRVGDVSPGMSPSGAPRKRARVGRL